MQRIIALCRSLGDRGRINSQAGRWCRLTQFQVEVIAGALLYVALCFIGVILMVVFRVWGLFR